MLSFCLDGLRHIESELLGAREELLVFLSIHPIPGTGINITCGYNGTGGTVWSTTIRWYKHVTWLPDMSHSFPYGYII